MHFKSQSVKNRRASEFRSILLIVISLIIIIVSGLILYQRYVGSDERILSTTLSNALTAESSQSRSITLTLSSNKQAQSVKLQILRARTSTDYESPASFNVRALNQTVTLPATVRFVDGQYYLKFNDASEKLTSLKTITSAIAPYVAYLEDLVLGAEGKWIQLDNLTSGTLPVTCINELSNLQFDRSDKKQMSSVLRKHKLFSDAEVISQRGEEKKYAVTFNNAKLYTAAEELLRNQNANGISATCKNAYLDNLDQLKSQEIEIGVNTQTKTLTSLTNSIQGRSMSIDLGDPKPATQISPPSKPAEFIRLSELIKNVPFLNLQ